MPKLHFIPTHYIQELQPDKTWLTIAGATSGYNAEIVVIGLRTIFPSNSFRSVLA